MDSYKKDSNLEMNFHIIFSSLQCNCGLFVQSIFWLFILKKVKNDIFILSTFEKRNSSHQNLSKAVFPLLGRRGNDTLIS